MSRRFFAESPSLTRIREFDSGVNSEFIANVNVSVEQGTVGMTPRELSRLATELLVEHLKNNAA